MIEKTKQNPQKAVSKGHGQGGAPNSRQFTEE